MQNEGANTLRTGKERNQLLTRAFLVQRASDSRETTDRVKTNLNVLILKLVQEDLDRVEAVVARRRFCNKSLGHAS